MKLAKVLCAYLLCDLKVTVDKHLLIVTKGITSNIKLRARFDLFNSETEETVIK